MPTQGRPPAPGAGLHRISTLASIRAKSWDDWLDIVAVVLLTTGSLLTAWNGYQSARWGGVQSTAYSEASSTRVRASDAATSGYLDTIIDVQTFNHWVDAYTSNDTMLMTFLERQFSDRLAPAVDAWKATSPKTNLDAPEAPWVMPEYVSPNIDRAEELTAKADALFTKGTDASERSDDYLLNTVYLATSLFFAGIAGKVAGRSAKAIIIVFGCLMLFYGLYHVVSWPII